MPAKAITILLLFFSAAGCVHTWSIHAKDGETLTGNWRLGREEGGAMRIFGEDGEVLSGQFTRVGQQTFVESYEYTFGRGSISVEGPEMSNFGGLVITSTTLMDVAYGENLQAEADAGRTRVAGPLFYWIAHLRGNRGSSMICLLVGSSYTGHGFGRCKNHLGKEFTALF